MNPQTRDFRHTIRPGEKTGDPFQSFRRRKASAWLIFSTAVTVGLFVFVAVSLPWSGGW